MRRLSNTFLDILLSLEQFNKDNQDFFFFVIKNQHSGHNKINWTKTITHTQAFVQNGSPIYLNPVNKRRQVNFDEELMVIYFSILNYIHKEYGFPFDAECHYELISGHQFMKKIPTNTDLSSIKYLLPMVGGSIDGYYDIEKLSIGSQNKSPVLRFNLGLYHNLGMDWKHIYNKMRPGEAITARQVEELYKE